MIVVSCPFCYLVNQFHCTFWIIIPLIRSISPESTKRPFSFIKGLFTILEFVPLLLKTVALRLLFLRTEEYFTRHSPSNTTEKLSSLLYEFKLFNLIWVYISEGMGKQSNQTPEIWCHMWSFLLLISKMSVSHTISLHELICFKHCSSAKFPY